VATAGSVADPERGEENPDPLPSTCREAVPETETGGC
jgi:hypothetical protein